MARYTRGKHAVLMDDIFGRKIKYKDARTQWDGKRVYKGDYTETVSYTHLTLPTKA